MNLMMNLDDESDDESDDLPELDGAPDGKLLNK